MAEKKQTKKTKETVAPAQETPVEEINKQQEMQSEVVETTEPLTETVEAPVDETPNVDNTSSETPAEEISETPYEPGDETLVPAPEETDAPEIDPEISADAKAIAETNLALEESKKQLSASLEAARNINEAKQLIQNEIKKVENIKKEHEKRIKKYTNMQISNSWNGMIEDW